MPLDRIRSSIEIRRLQAAESYRARLCATSLRRVARSISIALCAALAVVSAGTMPAKEAPQQPEKIDEINKEFHFLGPEDTVLIHEEDGKLKGQVNVYAGEEESDTVLSYDITIGTRTGNQVQFKTSKVHEKYFRFAGAVERGAGRKDRDPDYLRLVGDLQITVVNGTTGEETTETKHVILKSLGAEEVEEEN